MASSSSDDEDEAMAGLSLKNGRASTRGGLLGGELAQLDIPPNARLSGVSMSVEEDGTKVWTVTFKAKPKQQLDMKTLSACKNKSSQQT